VYYVDLTLRDEFIYKRRFKQPKKLIRKVKCGFNQAALDQMARQGYGNARFEVNAEEGLDLWRSFMQRTTSNKTR
jgi:hypothetical protein